MKPIHSTSRKEAILIMDSLFTPSIALRQQSFRGGWSKLYKAGDLYLDLTLKTEGSKVVLVGQAIAEAQKPVALNVVLHGPSGCEASPVNEYGIFRLNIQEKGSHMLEFDLGEETFMVPGLEVL